MSTLMLKFGDMLEGLSLRGDSTKNGFAVFSVFDLLSGACTHGDTASYARKTFQNLSAPSSPYAEEIAKLRYDIKFPGENISQTCFGGSENISQPVWT